MDCCDTKLFRPGFSGIIKPKNEQGHYGLSYEAFVVPLVKGMQEQQQLIDDQHKTLEAQHVRIAEQDKKISSLQQQLEEIKKLLLVK